MTWALPALSWLIPWACRPGSLEETAWETGLPEETGTTTQTSRWVWGDLHAHSRWSYDGCELPDDGCRPVGELPAEQFLAEAIAADLDFVALTDHAEMSAYYPEGLDGPAHNIWAGQQAVLAEAQGILGLLGYEWTWQTHEERDGHPIGGHRTVVLSDPAACEQARVRADHPVTGTIEVESDGSFYDEGSVSWAVTPGDLWEALDQARDTCGDLRWLSFAHHTAVLSPQPTDWGLSENTPTREHLVEIASEHGVGECTDLASEGCAWRVNPSVDHVPGGAVRTALRKGHRLGFTAGTDSHDARPGSLADGPGPVGYWGQVTGSPEPLQGHAPGGLTGVWLSGELTTESLFDALEARSTVATTGPRPEALVIQLQDAGGETHPPGTAVDSGDGPFTVVVEGLDASVEAITSESTVSLGTVSTATPLHWDWTPGPEDWIYLRLRVDSGDQEERLWASPWWGE